MNIKENNNDYEIIEKFLTEINEFSFIESGDEKYKKAINLIQSIPNIEDIKDVDKLSYYGNVSSLYYYIANIKCKRYGLSDGKRYNADNILEDKNRKYLNEILDDETNAFNYCKNGVNMNLINDILTKMNEEEKIDIEEMARKLLDQYEKNKERFRMITQELSILYYLIRDEDKFILYGNYAVEYNSLNAINLFLKYYCDKMDFDNADYYYDLMHTYPLDFYGSIQNNIALKIAGHKIYWEFFYNLGNYEESLRVGEECKEFILKYKLDNEVLLYAEKHIEECKLKIEESKKNKYTNDMLLKYFNEETVDLMSDDNKIYIITSLNIYEYMKSKKEITMDYSATLMPILKSIENMMFEIVGKSYHSFILEKKELDKKMIKAFINKKTDTIIEKMNHLELGDALSLMGFFNYYNEKVTPNDYFVEFCNKNNITNSKEVVVKIYKNLDSIRWERNKVAHKNRVDEDCVEECYSILLDRIKLINYLYKTFGFVFKENI